MNDDAPDTARHRYLSTSCLHGIHGHCQGEQAIDGGVKVPARCKWCESRCECSCHREPEQDTPARNA